MNFPGGVVLRIALSLVLLISVLSGTVAAATDGQPPTPPTSTSVALNTYGSLPVVVLNLTQSPINMNILANSTSYGNSLPLAAGLPGVYYANGGQTATLANILTPASAPLASTASTHSLDPAATVNSTTNGVTFGNSYGWMSLFTVFPSWTQPGTYNNVQYVLMGDTVNNMGAAAYSSQIFAGYPDWDGKNVMQDGHYTKASAINAGQPAVTTLKMKLMDSNGVTQAVYNININSLGGGTSGSVAIPQTGFSILHALHVALDVVTDIATCASGDPLGIIDFIAGIPGTIGGIVTDVSNNSNSTNVNITTDKAYPAKSKGINVTAAADSSNFPSGATLTAYSGDSQSLLYEVQPAANQQLPLIQQNAVFVTTWRQSPPDNYGITLPNGADTLFVVVLNQGVYASTQVQQYVNNNAPTQLAGGAKYQPTKAQAQDSAKILEILAAISQKNPQDAKMIIDLFGIHGKYDQIKNNPAEMKQLNAQLKTVFEKYKKELPAVEQYLAKLAQR